MESAGFITLLYIMYALPQELGIAELPWGNWTMAGCFVRLPHSPANYDSTDKLHSAHLVLQHTDCV
jgi:hypothetical protein